MLSFDEMRVKGKQNSAKINLPGYRLTETTCLRIYSEAVVREIIDEHIYNHSLLLWQINCIQIHTYK